VNSNIGQRLKAVEKHLEGEQEYLANYSDGLTDLPLPQQLEHFRKQDKIASFLCVRPNLSYHMISVEEGNGSLVSGIHAINNGAVRINGGPADSDAKPVSWIADKIGSFMGRASVVDSGFRNAPGRGSRPQARCLQGGRMLGLASSASLEAGARMDCRVVPCFPEW